jgi:uncharacterized protein (TIGR03083 family)
VVIQATVKNWQQGLDALREEVNRVTTLLRSIQDSQAPALGQWSIGELTMHLSQEWMVVSGLARRDLSPFYQVVPSLAGVAGDSLIRDMWDLAEVTNLGVQSDPERDLNVLADRIEAEADRYFSECAGADPNAPRPWLIEGVTVPQSFLTYHHLLEIVMHGNDIARAAGRPWRIEPAHAAMALERFIFPLINFAGPRVFVNHAKAAGRKATYDIRIRGGNHFYFVFDDGALMVETPSSHSVDCHISADPVAFLLLAFDRQSQWAAIAKGKLMAWGRKPWLGFQFRNLIRHP